MDRLSKLQPSMRCTMPCARACSLAGAFRGALVWNGDIDEGSLYVRGGNGTAEEFFNWGREL